MLQKFIRVIRAGCQICGVVAMPVKVESDLSEAKIEAALRPLIAAANLDDESVTAKSIRIQLEAKLGVDLTSRKKFVKEAITRILTEKPAPEPEQEDDDEDDDDDDEEEEARRPKAKPRKEKAAPRKRKAGAAAGASAEGSARGGFGTVSLSPALGGLLGVSTAARTEVTKLLWKYIKERDLQNPDDRREILLDGAMQDVFGSDVSSFTCFSMTKHVTPHLTKVAGPEGASSAAKKPRAAGGGGSGQPKQHLSAELAVVVGETEMARTQVVSKLWEYIKARDLQNPSDKREILCDGKLQNVFGQSSVHMFTMNKLLGSHFLGRVDE